MTETYNRSLDQFYTNDNIALKCFNILKNHVDITNYDHYLEPSAGKGAFYKLLNNEKRIGLDIDPKYEGIIRQDYFEYTHIVNKKYLVIGNPPFGKISSTAVKFYNKSAEFADCIAFIIPRTFKRVSIQNQLNMNFKLLHNEDLPMKPCCFTPKMSAKCCFQIWIKSDIKRTLVIYDNTHNDFTFCKLGPKDNRNQPTPPNNADFAIKAYGSGCGEIKSENLDELRPKSWHWIKSNIDIDALINRFKSLDFSISKDTVRQDSIGQKELIHLYKERYNNDNT